MRPKHAAIFAISVGLFSPAVLQAQDWRLVWSDEFDYTGLPDDTRWDYDVGGHGWGNQESQYYTRNRTQNARVENDRLIIEAHRENYSGAQYTSARLVSRNKGDWLYGRIEVRAKLPTGRGTWPAIWMLPTDWIYGNGGWPDNGEIDIMEHVGYDAGQIHATVHVNKYNHQRGNQRGGSITVADAQTAFHVYAIEWTAQQIDFFIDGTQYFQYRNEGVGWTSWPFDHPFHLILNIAIGGSWGGAQGIDNSIFPQRFEIDYVRVYENQGAPRVVLTGPEPGATLSAGAPLTITAEASDPDGVIQHVDFMQGEGVVATVKETPYAWRTDSAHPGCYAIWARGTDDHELVSHSDTVHVQVGDTCGQAPYLIAPHAIPGVIEAEHYDLGGPNTGYFDQDPGNAGDGIRHHEGVDIQTTTDAGGGYNVGWVIEQEWLAYTVDVKETGIYTVEARVASGAGGGRFALEMGEVDITGDISFPGTGGWQNWVSVRKEEVRLNAGQGVLYIRFRVRDFNVNKLTFTLVQATDTDADAQPESFDLSANYPNPFGSETRITYTIPRQTTVMLDLYNSLGQRVTTLANGMHQPGRYHVTVDGRSLPSGIYFYRLHTPEARHMRMMARLP